MSEGGKGSLSWIVGAEAVYGRSEQFRLNFCTATDQLLLLPRRSRRKNIWWFSTNDVKRLGCGVLVENFVVKVEGRNMRDAEHARETREKRDILRREI